MQKTRNGIICSSCDEVKHLSEFRDGRRACKKCESVNRQRLKRVAKSMDVNTFSIEYPVTSAGCGWGGQYSKDGVTYDAVTNKPLPVRASSWGNTTVSGSFEANPSWNGHNYTKPSLPDPEDLPAAYLKRCADYWNALVGEKDITKRIA